MKISYIQKGDYLLPNLELENKKEYNIGKYGLLILNNLKKNNKARYMELLMKDELNEFVHTSETLYMEQVQRLINEFAEKENINEELKSINQMLWVSKMNNIKNIAEEGNEYWHDVKIESQKPTKEELEEMENLLKEFQELKEDE